ncbi:Cyclin-U4-like protein [Hapsidospora chrysogenum ATCC 11550]|uniref:Cyclin-U4-like protein n=1 Tax=Hapsidospora chrysogenum (strain ATCC 11550 / CBS 779.69 / DSM 880 / IAM 14645 / JCM 23072 / IMI 49137) TaxID=857340 RepID=A0A086T6W3_HAPC1|nr:Cyclin-U4-like protein [Hapsidospora chrysogenum ATCC 11550]
MTDVVATTAAAAATTTTTTTTTTTSELAQPTTIHLEQTSAAPQSEALGDGGDSDDDGDDDDDHDLAKLPAAEALRLLSENLETLIRITGDVPPTPPLRTPTDPQMTGLQAEKDILARSSPRSTPPPSRRRSPHPHPHPHPPPTATATTGRDLSRVQAYSAALSQQIRAAQQQAIDGVRLKVPSSSSSSSSSSPSPSPSSTSSPPPASSSEGYPVLADDENHPLRTPPPTATARQHGAITRKFYSKLDPPISITAYLARLHQFCPSSAAVYIAASLYIHRLAVEQRAIPVTRRNVHRLVLAGLRVAAKALEDLAYPHRRVARVGGVSEAELARLEISFCFLAGFEVVVGEEALSAHWAMLRSGYGTAKGEGDVPALKMVAKDMPTPDE